MIVGIYRYYPHVDSIDAETAEDLIYIFIVGHNRLLNPVKK